MKVVTIEQKQTNERIIKILEKQLEGAKNGDIQSIAIAGIDSDGNTYNVFDVEINSVLMIGEIEILKTDVMDCKVQLRCPREDPII